MSIDNTLSSTVHVNRDPSISSAHRLRNSRLTIRKLRSSEAMSSSKFIFNKRKCDTNIVLFFVIAGKYSPRMDFVQYAFLECIQQCQLRQ